MRNAPQFVSGVACPIRPRKHPVLQADRKQLAVTIASASLGVGTLAATRLRRGSSRQLSELSASLPTASWTRRPKTLTRHPVAAALVPAAIHHLAPGESSLGCVQHSALRLETTWLAQTESQREEIA